ncbi:MAG TPA: glycosyltransferase [Gammaproteobacteria bacterium]|nr:glycosyltransferase [Gammaproteobacteria bacterium]
MDESRPEGKKRLAVLVSELGMGGMGKMRIQLMNALVAAGVSVDLLYGNEKSAYSLADLDARVRVLRLHTTHPVTGIPQLARYLRRVGPDALLAQRIRVNVLALRARRAAGTATRVYSTVNTHMSRALEEFPPGKRRQRLAAIRRFYPRNDRIIAVSRGAAEDFASLLGWKRGSIPVAPNPVFTPGLEDRAREGPDHPWFAPGAPPVVLGIGRLAYQKDFATLIRAFADFRRTHQARLVILGQGPLRRDLLALGQELGIGKDLDLPGFAANPYAYLAGSALYVLSSAWEGSPNALVEAMAMGTPVVATDCPSGPREILEDGRLAPLVRVGDAGALAAAMSRVYSDPPEPAPGKERARGHFSAARSAEAFMEIMGLSDGQEPSERAGRVAPAGQATTEGGPVYRSPADAGSS